MPSSRTQPAVDKSLIERLPKSFAPLLNEQLQHWSELFPAEQRPIEATLRYLGRMPEAELQTLLRPINELERRMELPQWTSASDRLSIEETSMLARSPLYPEWRAEVETFYRQVTEAIDETGNLSLRRLLVLVLPPGVPIEEQPLWKQVAREGSWVQLDRPYGEVEGRLLDALTGRPSPPGVEEIEHTWLLDAGETPAAKDGPRTLTTLSWTQLGRARDHYRRKLNEIDKDLRSADSTYQELLRFDIARLMPVRTGGDARLREFVRQLFLSGNGSVVFNNSFVQWGASEALRRAQPQAMLCHFGIRPKLKPFSSLVLFEDQNAANPVPDEPDPAGSLVDAEVLARYVYLTTGRLPAYQNRTITLFAGAASDLVLWVAPKGAPKPSLAATVAPDELTARLTGWLAS